MARCRQECCKICSSSTFAMKSLCQHFLAALLPAIPCSARTLAVALGDGPKTVSVSGRQDLKTRKALKQVTQSQRNTLAERLFCLSS